MSGGKHLNEVSIKPEFPDDGVFLLYSMRFCPYAHRVHLVLDAKKIPYHSIFINLKEKPVWLRQVSPLGKVPALELVKEPGRPTLIESLIICEYLDECYPDRLLYPKDPLKKAQEKILIERFGEFIKAVHKIMLYDKPDLSNIDLYSGLDIYEEELKKRGSAFFGGEQPGILDYMMWPWCERFSGLQCLLGPHVELDPARFGNLIKWRDLMLQDDAVKCFYLDGETHAKYMSSRRTGNPDYDILVNSAKRQKTTK